MFSQGSSSIIETTKLIEQQREIDHVVRTLKKQYLDLNLSSALKSCETTQLIY